MLHEQVMRNECVLPELDFYCDALLYEVGLVV